MKSLTQQFADEYAKGVVPANLKAIKLSRRINLTLLAAAIACTYWHQAHYLSGIEGFGMSVAGFDVNFGYIAPLIWDVAMVSNANTLQTPAMHEDAKRRAVTMMVAAGLLSMVVNLAAPGNWVARALFAALVAVAVGQKWASAAIRPNFAALERLETEAVTQVSATRKLDPVVARERAEKAAATRRRNADAKLTPAQKAARTRARNKLVDAEFAEITGVEVPPNAPVSPALF